MQQTSGRTRFRQRLPRFIGWFFGLLWALIGVSALPRPYDRAGLVVALAVAGLFVVRLWKAPLTAQSRSLFRTRAYVVSVVAEVAAIYAASFLLRRYGAEQQILPAVGVIVGLHFIGLWMATRSSRFLSITAGMCAVSLLAMFVPFASHGIGTRNLLLGVGNALVLWWNAAAGE